MPFGHDPMPSFEAASIMFCAARPASNAVGPLPPTTTATTSAAPSTLSEAYTHSAARSTNAGSRRTTKRRAWRFFELPATRPASRIRRCAPASIGRVS